MRAMIVDRKVVIIVTPTISLALVLPYIILRLMTVVGMIVTEEVLITKNVIMLREATSLLLFSLCSSLIALRPKGVAALPSPSIFITIFEDIYPIAGSPSEISGKITLINLDNFFETISRSFRYFHRTEP